MMRNIVLLVIGLVGGVPAACAQKSYVGLATGINNYTGILGAGIQVGLTPQWSLRGGAGVGSWGTKVTGGVLFSPTSKSKWKINAAFSSASGVDDIELDLDTDGGNKLVLLNLNRQGLVNLSLVRFYENKKSRGFVLEFGYSFIAGPATFYTVKDGSSLASSSIRLLNVLRPGGFTLGMGYMICFHGHDEE
jgi:hypothetical protein